MSELAILGLLGGLGLVIIGAGWRRMEPSTPRRVLCSAGLRIGLLSPGESADRLRRDLAVTGRHLETHAAGVTVATLAGGLAPLVALSLAPGVGWHPPLALTIAFSLAGAALGATLPSVALRSAAREARRRFVSSLSSWLDLVALGQAGGMGVEGALDAASRLSADFAFVCISRGLEGARHAGTAPWDAMARLGRELGVPELEELSASLGLAGTEGARIRAGLAAKAASLRHRQLAAARARANATTERLFIPTTVLMLGFMVFLMYPAGVALSRGL